ncbi:MULTISPECIES: hypothetical protein [Acidobacterium]|uniref:hypothetical protein n=1 Tax=Acidobacterium TaxID=33973 RepID=UPI0005A18D5A|nr:MULTISPECIES: hypothetical protein [Acidobacterium]HCT60008.1 hypothetical protein [Acidobacterium sp.]
MKRAAHHRSVWSLLLLLLVSLQAAALTCGIRCEAMTLSMAAAQPGMPTCGMPSMRTPQPERHSGALPVQHCDKLCHHGGKLMQTQASHAPQAHWQALLVLPAIHPAAMPAVALNVRIVQSRRKHAPLPSFHPAVSQLRI